MNSKLAKQKVLIKGASIAGLTAAARLSKNGYQCHLIGLIGDGYENTLIDGYQFDSAPLFTLPATFRDFFQKTGKHFGQVLEVEPKDPAFTFQFDDVIIQFANLSHSARIHEITEKLGQSAAKEWDQLIKTGEYFWDQLRENYLEWEFSIWRANLPVYLRLKAPYIRDPHLKRILAHYATYFGYPAGIYKWSSLIAFAEESFGIWQIKGGLGALMNSLKSRAAEVGVIFQSTSDFEYLIESTEVFNRPTQRLIGIKGYQGEIPIRTVIFHPQGQTTDIYATRNSKESYSLVITGKLEFSEFEEFTKFVEVDQIRPAIIGNADNRLITRIRSANKHHLIARHLDSLAHGAIAGELLANAVRGIKNRPSHEH